MTKEQQQIQALKSKVDSALKLCEWLSKNISRMEYLQENMNVPIEKNEGYIALCDSMRDGFMASHHEEFNYRDMHDDKIFPDEFKKVS